MEINETPEELKVVPLTEVNEKFDKVAGNVASLKEQMKSDREATGLALEERADDAKKAFDSVEEITKQMDDLVKAVEHNKVAMQYGTTDNDLKASLRSFQGGFKEFSPGFPAREMPIGTKPSIKHLIEGVFVPSGDELNPAFHAPKHAAILQLQKAANDAYAVDQIMRSQMSDAQQREYDSRGGVESLKTYKRFVHIAQEFSKAVTELIDTSTEVTNWVPTQYGSNLYELIRIGLPELTLFQEITMSAPTMVLPLNMNDHEGMRVTEITSATNANPYADVNFMNPGALASNKITLTAEKIRARYWLSEEANEDTVVAMLPFLNRGMVRGLQEAIADAIVNGQITSNLDTAGTHFSKSNPPASTDARDCWDGLRWHCDAYTGSNRVDDSNSYPLVTDLRLLRASMGEYGVNPSIVAYLFGIFGYIKLLDDDDVMTIDKFGPNATVRTGSLAQVDGCDVVVSRRMPQNLNASGIIDNITTNRTTALAVNTECFLLGNRRRVTLESVRHASSDTTELVAFWRGDFQPVQPSASTPTSAELYNVKAV